MVKNLVSNKYWRLRVAMEEASNPKGPFSSSKERQGLVTQQSTLRTLSARNTFRTFQAGKLSCMQPK